MTVTTWPPARQILVGLTVAVGALTGVGASAAGASGWSALAALAYGITVVWAVADPRAVTMQTVVGVLMCASFLIDADRTVIAVVPVVAGVVATAELSTAAGRLGMVVRREPGPELVRVAIATAIAVVSAGATLAVSALPGPEGLIATVVGAIGLALIAGAVRLDRRSDKRPDRPRATGDTVTR